MAASETMGCSFLRAGGGPARLDRPFGRFSLSLVPKRKKRLKSCEGLESCPEIRLSLSTGRARRVCVSCLFGTTRRDAHDARFRIVEKVLSLKKIRPRQGLVAGYPTAMQRMDGLQADLNAYQSNFNAAHLAQYQARLWAEEVSAQSLRASLELCVFSY